MQRMLPFIGLAMILAVNAGMWYAAPSRVVKLPPVKAHRVKAQTADGTFVGEWSGVRAAWLTGRSVCSIRFDDGRIIYVTAPIIIVEEIEASAEAVTTTSP